MLDNIEQSINEFQSTPSAGRATLSFRKLTEYEVISIHALRGEGDRRHADARHFAPISIHALRGEGDA